MVALPLAILIGCASSGAFQRLPRVEQDRFERCWASIQGAVCGSRGGTGTGSEACKEQAQSRYSARETEEARHRYLSEYGCVE
jgi:hypothetical protein